MKAVVVNELGTPPMVRDDLAPPTPGADQLLVRVRASSANQVDNAIAAGMLKDIEHGFPVTLDRDDAGVVEQVGSAISGYAVGDEVFGLVPHANPAVHDGAWLS
jgi:NADPH:quinone reductase